MTTMSAAIEYINSDEPFGVVAEEAAAGDAEADETTTI
jgi:hypothetical protein